MFRGRSSKYDKVFRAAEEGQVSKLKRLLLSGCSVHAHQHETGHTALHVACLHNQLEVVTFLLQECGASVHTKNHKANTALHLAAQKHHVAVAARLLEHESHQNNNSNNNNNNINNNHQSQNNNNNNNPCQSQSSSNNNNNHHHPNRLVHATNAWGETALHKAAAASWKNPHHYYSTTPKAPKQTQKQTQKQTPASADNMTNNTPNQQHLMILLLLKYGAAAHARKHDGNTPLHLAAGFGQLTAVVTLLECKYTAGTGTSPPSNGHDFIMAQRGHKDWTALHAACQEGHHAVVEYLLQHGADWKATNAAGETPLHKAASQGHVAVVRLLLHEYYLHHHDDNADHHHHDDDGSDNHHSSTTTKSLLPTLQPNHKGNTPLHSAAGFGRVAVVEAMIEISRQYYCRSRRASSSNNKNNHVKLLLQATNDKNETALEVAQSHPRLDAVPQQHYQAVVQLLRDAQQESASSSTTTSLLDDEDDDGGDDWPATITVTPILSTQPKYSSRPLPPTAAAAAAVSPLHTPPSDNDKHCTFMTTPHKTTTRTKSNNKSTTTTKAKTKQDELLQLIVIFSVVCFAVLVYYANEMAVSLVGGGGGGHDDEGPP